MADIPREAICDEHGCGHPFSRHDGLAKGCSECRLLKTGADANHDFKPRLLFGKIVTPNSELDAYQKAMRGEF